MVGGGVAGLTCAIVARDLGLQVLLVEKSAELGGACRWSGGNLLDVGRNTGLAHLRSLSLDKTDDQVLAAYAGGLHEVGAWLEGLGADLVHPPLTGPGSVAQCWPHAPGADEVGYYRVAGDAPGPALVELLTRALRDRAVDVRNETTLAGLDTDASGRVIGGVLRDASGSTPVTAGAVVLTTGGFENAPELCDAYLPVSPTFALAQLANTGDGLRLAQSVGAAVWHMSNYFGYWGTRVEAHPAPFAIRLADPGHLLVDSRGHRFATETGREVHDVLRTLGSALPDHPHLPGLPAYAIFDRACLDAGPLSRMPSPNTYRWSADNAAEIEAGWIVGGADVRELADQLGLDAAVLEASVARYNDAATAGHDPDFGRAGDTMRPIDSGEVYAVALWPGIATTAGGPRRDASARVLRWDGTAVPGLLAAGGNGSVWGHLTQHGGGLTDGLVFGRIAANTVAAAHAGTSGPAPDLSPRA